MLFQPSFPRTGGRADLRESNFQYLQRSNRPQAIQICEYMEKWCRELPFAVKGDFESRLEARTAQTFHGALFELGFPIVMEQFWLLRNLAAGSPQRS